jgi:phosphate starvation-inducible PhoH-like protein
MARYTRPESTPAVGGRRREPASSDVGSTTELKIIVPGRHAMVSLLGHRDELLKVIESSFDASIIARGNEIRIMGAAAEAERVAYLFEELITLLDTEPILTTESLGRTIEMVKNDDGRPSEVLTETALMHRGKTVRPKTAGQKRYVDAIRGNTITFGIGPAGTGKTYLAVAMAVAALQAKDVTRLILTRPAVEAGERLGYLPGTLYEKIDPYMRPLYDALMDMMDADKMAQLMQRGTIELSPLAYMRGRTLNDAFIILDEAQNTTPEQMKMFLTRLGFGSKVVVTGDITQIDLPSSQFSGLNAAREILTDINDVSFVFLGARDVVRHKIVQEIVEAYRRFDESR